MKNMIKITILLLTTACVTEPRLRENQTVIILDGMHKESTGVITRVEGDKCFVEHIINPQGKAAQYPVLMFCKNLDPIL